LLMRTCLSPLSPLFFLLTPPPPRSTLFPYTTLFRSRAGPPSPGRVRRRGRDPPRTPRPAVEARRSMPTCRSDGGSVPGLHLASEDRKSTRLNSSHVSISYAVFCLKKKKKNKKKNKKV